MISDNVKYLLKYNLPILILGICLIPFVENIWIVLTIFVLSYFLIYIIGFNFYIHRVVSHRQFQINPKIGFVFGYLGSLSMLGDPLTFALTHRYHHRYSDTDKDLHSPIHGRWHSAVGWLFKKNNLKSYLILIKDLNRTAYPHLHILHKYNFIIFWSTVLLVGLISKDALFGLIITMVLSFVLEMVGNSIFYHSKSKRSSVNNLYSYLSLSFFHADHHKDPSGKTLVDPLEPLYRGLSKFKIIK